MNIKESINIFLEGNNKNKGRLANERYASFDFCYNYFYGFYKNGKIKELRNEKNLQISCLQLGFYLASWGMLRGSSFLLEKSIRNFKDVVIVISQTSPHLWEIDINNYNEENINLLLECKNQITNALGKENNPSDTLVTKIMLGVFCNIPAYDQYFKKSLEVNAINKKSLLKFRDFYDKNKKDFDSFEIHTLDFLTTKETEIIYKKAKLLDMYGFINGQKDLKN